MRGRPAERERDVLIDRRREMKTLYWGNSKI